MNQMNFSTAPDGSQVPVHAGGSATGADHGAARNSSLDVGDLLRILSERKYIIIGAALLGLVLGIVASLLMTPLYRSTALLELNPPTTEVLADKSQVNRGSADAQMATQLGLLHSDSLARRVAQDLNLVSRPEFGGTGSREARLDRAVLILQAYTSIGAVRGSNLIEVAHISPDPALAARIANAIASGFIASNLERNFDSSSYARNFLKNQLASTKSSLEDSERQLNDYAIQSGIFRTPGKTVNGVTSEGSSLAATNLESLNAARNEARIRRITAEQAYLNGTNQQNSTANEAVTALRQQRAALQVQYDEKSKLFKDDYPEMRELQAKIAALGTAIRGEFTNSTGGRRADLLADYKAAKSAEAALDAQVGTYKGDVQGERSRSIQYNILQREVDTNRSLYDALLQRYKEIGVAGGIGRSEISLVDTAQPPQSPFRPNIPLNAILGLFAGLAMGVAAAALAHLLFDNLVTPADVRNKLGLPVLGVIPAENDDRPLFEALADQKSDISEAYYSVRTTLRFVDLEGEPRSLLVTSTRPGEGKSTSAYAIASIFARTGSKVLLIDADLRKPTFVSSQSEGRGLAWLLGNDEPLQNYVEATQTPNLSLLPVGRFTGSAAELLGSTRLPHIAQDAMKQFELVVFDGPPVLGLADAPLLGAIAEKTIIVVESREARTGAVAEMIRRLQASGTTIAGVILTKVRGDNAGYGYNYYSYNYGTDGVGGRVSSDPSRAMNVSVGGKPSQ